MRKKTEKKRQEIIQAASEIFRELGFERASMSKICTRFGGSKTTLYNYFSSKEELFVEVVSLANADDFDFAHETINNQIDNMNEQLYIFARRFLHFLYSPKLMKIRRITISQSGITDLGKFTYKSRIVKSNKILSTYLQKAIEEKKIKKTDTTIAAKHLFALIESELMHEFLFQVDVKFENEQMDEMAKRAVDVFICAYGI